jgi:hypothetical protein
MQIELLTQQGRHQVIVFDFTPPAARHLVLLAASWQ